MPDISLYLKNNRVVLLLPGNRMLQFEPDGDLQAINGAGSTQISIRKTENQEFLVTNWEFDEILDDNDAAYDSSSRDNVRDKLNDDIFNGDLKPTAVGITVKNNVSAVLAKGTPVYVSGYDSSSRLPLVAGSYKFTAGTMPATFILNEDLAASGTGEALLIGTLSDIDTSSFSVGDELYVNEANLSNTIPTGTDAVQSVGFVLESHATTGKVALHGLGTTAPTDTNTNIGNTNLSVSGGTRSLSLTGTNTSFRIMTGQGTPFRVTNTSGNGGSVTINGDFRVDSGALSGGIIKLEENPQGGSNFVALQAPNSLSSDLTFVMPSADGSAGQFLKTDGSGSLSFGSAGSSSTMLPIANVSGRFMWSSADDAERVYTGSSVYGPYNFYSHSVEPTVVAIREYTGSEVVGSTTASIISYKVFTHGIKNAYAGKKVRVDYSFRIYYSGSSAPTTGTPFGFSVWSGNAPATGSTSNVTVTYRGESDDHAMIAPQAGGTTAHHHGSFTTSTSIDDDYLLVLAEHRNSTGLNSTTYMVANYNVYLTD